MVHPPSLHSRIFFRTLASICFFLSIAGITYLGFRPSLTRAIESANAFSTLEIPSISLSSEVTEVKLQDRELIAPETIVGAYHAAENKEFLIGHSSTIFKDLKNLTIGSKITYQDRTYTVSIITTQAKADISMSELLKSESTPTLVLMTCYGESLGGNDYSHRLIITATTPEDSTE